MSDHLNAGTDALVDNDDMPELTDEQLAQMKPLYNAEERAILQGSPTDFQRSQVLRSALLRLKQESKQ